METDGYYENGFREIPRMDVTSSGGNIFDVAVNILSAQLRGGNAIKMAEFLQLAVRAVQANGYGITYAVGPIGEFGLLVVPMDAETGEPDSKQMRTDYSLWCEIGTADMLRETLSVATATGIHTPALMDAVPEQKNATGPTTI